MLPDENLADMSGKMNLDKSQSLSKPSYHRASYVSLLRFIQSRIIIIVGWGNFVDFLTERIKDSSKCPLLASKYLQELSAQLYTPGVYPIVARDKVYNAGKEPLRGARWLRGWVDIPPTVWVTLEIPRTFLPLFTHGDPADIGSVPVHGSLYSPGPSVAKGWHDAFAAVQLGFGTLSTTGQRNSNDFAIHIANDPDGWQGKSPLFVSFMVSTRSLLLDEAESTMVSLDLRSTVTTGDQSLDRLKTTSLAVFATAIGNANRAYITRNPPNQNGSPVIPGLNRNDMISVCLNPGAVTSILVNIDDKSRALSSFMAGICVISDHLMDLFDSGCVVKLAATSPVQLQVSLDSELINITFPLPVIWKNSKGRVLRRCYCIEVICPVVTEPSRFYSPAYVYPIAFEGGTPVLRNIHYVNLQALPVIDISQRDKLEWLIGHTFTMFSARERRLWKNQELEALEGERIRVSFKDSLYSLLMQFTGLRGRKAHLFGICDSGNGDVHILLFVSAMRLDIANRSVVLDLGVIALSGKLVPVIREALAMVQSSRLCKIMVNAEVMRLWKQLLPAFVERCRTWSHRGSCEYIAAGNRAPLSVDPGKPTLCTCGNGVFPPDFKVDPLKWDRVSRLAVRAAISPAFFSALVEDLGGPV